MIDEQAAVAVATQLLGRPSDDSESPWSLREFPQGWLIREQLKGRGGVAKVIERVTGKIKYFPSGVPPTIILEEYETVVDEAQEVSSTGN